jgi:phosphoglycerate-specific signal transduction histidine kinase
LTESIDLQKIRRRAAYYEVLGDIATVADTHQLSTFERHYAQDVPRLLQEIDQLQEQLRDREADLQFEYEERLQAERKLEEVEEKFRETKASAGIVPPF